MRKHQVFGASLSWCMAVFLSSCVDAFAISPRPSRPTKTFLPSSSSTDNNDDPFLPLWKLASAHCASQALHTVIELDIPKLLLNKPNGATLKEIAHHVSSSPPMSAPQSDALLRLLRLLTTVDILVEEKRRDDDAVCFSLTRTGKLLVDGETGESSGMAAGIQHWMEAPLWSSWLQVPAYLREGFPLPFERANDGISSDFYYNQQDHPESLQKANNFVQWVHQQEVQAVLTGFEWSSLQEQRLVDIGGHYGTVLAAISKDHPSIQCTSLDLPQVIESAPDPPEGVTLQGGNALDPSTIPPCEAILLKHFLDRCMWTEEETVQILQNCQSALTAKRRVIIAEAVLPDASSSHHHHPTALYMDALYMLVGREGQRTESEWRSLAERAGFRIQQIRTTSIPSCSILVLEPVV